MRVKRETIFQIAAALFLVAAFVHLRGLLAAAGNPSLAAFHGIFVAIDPLAAMMLLRRPPWFPYAFAVLTVQQIYSHGLEALTAWRDAARIDVISIFIVVAMPILLVLLVYDAVHRRAQSR